MISTRLALPSLALFAIAFAVDRGQSSVQLPEHPEVVLVPHVLRGVRHLGPIDLHLSVYHWGGRAEKIHLRRMRLEVDGVELASRELDLDLAADKRFGELQALIERLPQELSHRHEASRFYAPLGTRDFDLREGLELLPARQSGHGAWMGALYVSA